MKTQVKSLLIILSIDLMMGCSKTEEIDVKPILDQESARSKNMHLKVLPSMSDDVLIKAEQDWNNINDALEQAQTGAVIHLAEGLFYLPKSIVVWNFNGTLRGSGMNETTIQTVPGALFDVEASPPFNWSFEQHEGGYMICFPHEYTDDERSVSVKDLSIVVSEPSTPYTRWIGSPKEMEFNSIRAIVTFYANLDNDLANPIDLNVSYNNISIIGEQDEKYHYKGYSIFHGLAAFGLSNGSFEAKNVTIENASGCIAPSAFYGEDATVTIKNARLESCFYGIFSFMNHSWSILNNEIENSQNAITLLKQRPGGGGLVDGPDGISFVKNNRIHFMGRLGLGIQNLKNVQVKNNIVEGSGRFGAIACAGVKGGDNWIIKDNNLCGVVPISPFNCTIYLSDLVNSEIRNNANQLIGGPGADEPSNIIGEGVACDED